MIRGVIRGIKHLLLSLSKRTIMVAPATARVATEEVEGAGGGSGAGQRRRRRPEAAAVTTTVEVVGGRDG